MKCVECDGGREDRCHVCNKFINVTYSDVQFAFILGFCVPIVLYIILYCRLK